MHRTVLWVCLLAAAIDFAACNQVMLPVKVKEITGTDDLTDSEREALLNPGNTREIVEERGDGKFISDAWAAKQKNEELEKKGEEPIPHTYYYIDAENGNDAYDGKHPTTPWKSFRRANAKTFQAGDFILLEADSIWNGKPVDINNYKTLPNSADVGMLWPKGSGKPGADGWQDKDYQIIIDLYDIDDFNAEKPTVYYSADKRPIINGNGTPSTDISAPYRGSAAIFLEDLEYWAIRNIEVTNTFDDFSNPATRRTHWYRRDVRKALYGILIRPTLIENPKGNRIEYCYAHDVQSEHNNNGQGMVANSYFGPASAPGKDGGGILYGGADLLVQYNIVRRTALEGTRTVHGGRADKVIMRGNFVEEVAGDGMVISRIGKNGLVESNLIKDACAAPNFGGGNYAGNWCYYADNTIFQYNEGYGTRYGYLDGEAFDIDNSSAQVIYQYNYSHHNAGGACLFMSAIENGVFRYNISANDGGGARYVATTFTGEYADSHLQSEMTTSNSYKNWTEGQTIFHYTNGASSGVASIPLIYNNTFYVGDGLTTGLVGHNDGNKGSSKYVRFYNNVVIKEGAGKLHLSYSGDPGGTKAGNGEGYIKNPAGVKNNIFWADGTGKILNGNEDILTATGDKNLDVSASEGHRNRWIDPRLNIQLPGGPEKLLAQRHTPLSLTPVTRTGDWWPAMGGLTLGAEDMQKFAGKKRFRARASLFAPQNESSPVIGAGMEIPVGAKVPEVDNAWNNMPAHYATYGNQLSDVAFDEDLFGRKITGAPPVGAAVGPYTPEDGYDDMGNLSQ